MNKKFIFFLFLLLSIPFVVYYSDQIQQLLGRAAPKPANIVIDTQQTTGPLPQPWKGFAQGGEEPPPMLTSTVLPMRDLGPRMIRLDHIYDAYSIVSKTPEGYSYNFSSLDTTVDDIRAMGAVPFLSLSYMPSVFTSSGSVIDAPQKWDDWKNLVRATIEHFSGTSGKNIPDVYYEVWNEPDLPQFGSWKLSPEKDYRVLYFHAAQAAAEATGVNRFYFGGPAVGSFYPNWVRDFVTYVEQNKLRLDFYSWHRYHKNPDIFSSDAKGIKNILAGSNHSNIPLIISEWGIESDNKPMNNSKAAAAHAIAATAAMLDDVDMGFMFEVKDGPPPSGGKWGLLTHEKDQTPLSPKPKYLAFSSLSKMEGERLMVSGQGTYVRGFSSRLKDSTIRVILANYDLSGTNVENVPVTFTHLVPASYTLSITYPLEGTVSNQEVISTNGTVQKSILLPANGIVYLELTSSGPLASFVSGRSGQPDDSALVLSGTSNLIFSSPEFRLRPIGKISFDIKPLWETNDVLSFHIFDAPFATESGILQRLSLTKQKSQEGQTLSIGVSAAGKDVLATSPFSWEKNTWHHVEISWQPDELFLRVDDQPSVVTQYGFDIRNGETLTFYPIDAVLDNLRIELGNNQIISRQFNSGTAQK